MRKTKAQQYPLFFALLRQLSPAWVEEHRFHPARKWRFDFARPDIRLAIEVDGGIWTGGRHSGGQGQLDDFEKGNAAACLGWRILHFEPKAVANGSAYRLVESMQVEGGA